MADGTDQHFIAPGRVGDPSVNNGKPGYGFLLHKSRSKTP
uniref:Uncharacterized protein n=1 Tax=Klebsiella pneumoniae TaxID=573 RepID=A0A8B0SUM8_KLEPN|nr:hypothetical protein [Klebsiella pneumoniae]